MDRVDAGSVWDLLPEHKGRRKAYFFIGDVYTRFDVESGVEDYGYPQYIRKHWTGLWSDRIDAVIVWPVKVSKRRKAYFFRGGQYLRWDIKGNHPDYTKPIDGNWNNWPSSWNHVDAAVHFPGDSTVYFFSGSEYAKFSVVKDEFTTGPRPISGGWPGLPDSGIAAGLGWPLANADGDLDKAYFFWDTRYFRYDLAREAPDGGYPRMTADEWPARAVCIWAATDVPNTVDEDARLHEADGKTLSKLQWPEGSTRGQAGWNIGLNYATFARLLEQMEKLELPDYLGTGRLHPGEVNRLALNAHGSAGRIFLNGVHSKANALMITNLRHGSDMYTDCMALEKWLAPDATVLFMGCSAGTGKAGTALLKHLSLLWPGRSVVMFWSIGYQWPAGMSRKGAKRSEAGMRDTHETNESVTVRGTKAYADFEIEMLRRWPDLKKLPWASHASFTARVARNGETRVDTLPVALR